MTDKEKIKSIIELFIAWNGETEVIDIANLDSAVDFIIDSLQKEPVSEDFEMALAEMIDKAQTSVVEPWVIAAQWKDELIKLAKSEEPVSEGLKEAATLYAKEEYSRKNPATLPDRCVGCYAPLMYAFKAGAQWQKERFEKNRLKHCNSITNEQAELEQGFIDQHLDKYNRMPTFLDAIEYGMRLQKQQMMKGAFIPGFKSIEFKLGEEYTFNSKNFDMEKAKAYGAKEGDTIIGYFIKKED